jgi:hypothetical protein
MLGLCDGGPGDEQDTTARTLTSATAVNLIAVPPADCLTTSSSHHAGPAWYRQPAA